MDQPPRSEPALTDIKAPPAAELSPPVAALLAADDRRIVITGAGGWLGLATLDLLSTALGREFQTRVRCYGSSSRRLHLQRNRWIDQLPLSQMRLLNKRPTIVLHLAFLTKERANNMDEQAYRAANLSLRANVLDVLDGLGANAVFVASSGAARYADDAKASIAMRLYGSLKVGDEDVFAKWARERNATAVIARIFNISGPYINKHEAYAFASFINDALANRSIKVQAPHRVIRSYVAIRELMSLVFSLLLEPSKISRFDSGGYPLELADVAAIIGRLLGAATVERAAITNLKVDDYFGDGKSYQRLLEQYSIASVSLETQVLETAAYLAAV